MTNLFVRLQNTKSIVSVGVARSKSVRFEKEEEENVQDNKLENDDNLYEGRQKCKLALIGAKLQNVPTHKQNKKLSDHPHQDSEKKKQDFVIKQK